MAAQVVKLGAKKWACLGTLQKSPRKEKGLFEKQSGKSNYPVSARQAGEDGWNYACESPFEKDIFKAYQFLTWIEKLKRIS